MSDEVKVIRGVDMHLNLPKDPLWQVIDRRPSGFITVTSVYDGITEEELNNVSIQVDVEQDDAP